MHVHVLSLSTLLPWLRRSAATVVILAFVVLGTGVPVQAASTSFLDAAGSPAGWTSYWLVAQQDAWLYAHATGEEQLSSVAAGTFYRVDAPVEAGRAWVLNPLTGGWAWLPTTVASPTQPPTQEQIDAFFQPALPDPRGYLYRQHPTIAARMDCVIQHESRWDPRAKNPRSTASGLAQFLDSTWARTPQARAGHSPFDPYANIDAAAWLQQTLGWSQWQVVTVGLC